MISGLNSFSISSALRTAQAANYRVDKAIQQMATGSKVASVKDDGATYARANALRSENFARDALSMNVTTIQHKAAYTDAASQAMMEMTLSLRNNLLTLSNTKEGSSEFTALADMTKTQFADILRFNSQGGWGYTLDDFAAVLASYGGDYDALWVDLSTAQIQNMDGTFDNEKMARGDVTYSDVVSGGFVAGIGNYRENSHGDRFYMTDPWSGDLVVQDQAMARSAANFFSNAIAWIGAEQGAAESVLNRVERHSAQNQKMADIAENYISSLVDADLAKLAKDKELSQTRQQLAYSMVSSALTQYGSFAGGLLQNVLGTQRSILA